MFAKYCFRGLLCPLSVMPTLEHALYQGSKTLCLESFQNLCGCPSGDGCFWGVWKELVYVKVSIHVWGRKRRAVSHRLGTMFFCSATSEFEPTFWVI